MATKTTSAASRFLLSQLNIPIYGTAFTLALVERRLEEHELLKQTKLNTVKPGDVVELGPFKIEFIRVTHSIVSCVALAITTPLGVIIHTGDFKVDPTPTDNELFDLHTLAEYRQARRAAADVGFDQRRPARLHRERTRRPAAPGRSVRPLAERAWSSPASAPRSIACSRFSISPTSTAARSRSSAAACNNVTEIAHNLGLLADPRRHPAPPAGHHADAARTRSAWSRPARRASRCRRSRASRSTITSL